MKIDFIPLANVPTVESLTDSAKVLVVDSGEVKKTAKSNIGGGGGGFASEVLTTQARATLNIIDSTAPVLSESLWDFAYVLTEGEWYPAFAIDATPGQSTFAFFGRGSEATDPIYAGFDITNPTDWEITIGSGNASYETDENGAWVEIRGDCVINAKYIGE